MRGFDEGQPGEFSQIFIIPETMLWRFKESPSLDLTNNTAERALSPYVIWRKISCFGQSKHGDISRAGVMTVDDLTYARPCCAKKDPVTLRWPIAPPCSTPLTSDRKDDCPTNPRKRLPRYRP